MDKSLFKRAVEDTPEPTPGYMFRDMANWTFKDFNTQNKFISTLFDKIKPTQSVHVLAKALRIIKVMCETGHTDFQKQMQRRSDELKEYASFRGKPDAKVGDAYNEKVRVAAREAIEAAFSHRPEERVNIGEGMGSSAEPSQPAGGFASAIQSKLGLFKGSGNAGGSGSGFSSFTDNRPMGSSAVGTTNAASSSSANGGFSSSNMAPMPTRNLWAEHMQQATTEQNTGGISGVASKVVNRFTNKAKTGFGLWNESYQSSHDRIAASANMFGGASGPGEFGAQSDSSFQPVNLSDVTSADTATGWGAKDGSSAGSGGGWKFTGDDASPGDNGASGFVLKDAITGAHNSPQVMTPFQQEVMRMATFKATPQRVELHGFVNACERICQENGGAEETDFEDLAQAMDERLQQKFTWQQRLNVLACLEALLRAATTVDVMNEPAKASFLNACHAAMVEYFTENPEDVQRNVFVVQTSLKEKAQKVLKLLGIREKQGSSSVDAGATDRANSNPSTSGTSSAMQGASQFTSAATPFGAVSWSTGATSESTTEAAGGGGDLDLGGMKMRSRGGAEKKRDNTKLAKRAQMQIATEEEQAEETQGFGTGFTSAANANSGNNTNSNTGFSFGADSGTFSQPTTTSNQNSNFNGFGAFGTSEVNTAQPPATSTTLDDLFGMPSSQPTGTAQPSGQVPRPSQQQQQQPKSTQSDSLDLFFGSGNVAAQPGSDMFAFSNPPINAPNAGGNFSSVSAWGTGGTAPSSESAFFTKSPAPSSSSPPAAPEMSREMLEQLNGQLQMLMEQGRQTSDPNVLAQLQQMMMQQQALMRQFATTYSRGGAAGSAPATWGEAPSATGRVSGEPNEPSSPLRPHNHLTVAPTEAHRAPDVFQSVQQEMMQRLQNQ